MKQLYFLLCSYLLLCNITYAQIPQYHWLNQLGGVGNDRGGYVAYDSKGSVYTASSTGTSTSFKPGTIKEIEFLKTTSILESDLIITKVNEVGNFLWAKQIGKVIPMSICIDNRDNIVIVGIYEGTVDFNPGSGIFNLTEKGNGDVFILKLDKNGDFVWAGSIGGKGIESVVSIITDKMDNLAFICQFNDTIDLDISTAGVYNVLPTSGYESVALKLDSNGKFIWAHHLKDINPIALSFDSSGNLYSTGYFLGTKDFDFGTGVFNMTTTGAATSGDGYVLKEDTAGKFLWAKSFGEFINRDNPSCIKVDKNDNVIVGGNCGGGNSDFDPGPGVTNLIGNTDFILKLSNAGNFIWAKGINGGIYPFNFTAIGVDDSNRVYTCGNFDATVDFDPSAGAAFLSSLAATDGFILQLDSNGLFKWVSQLQCTGSLYPSSMHVAKNGNLFLGGTFTLKADFDPGLSSKVDSSVGNNDVFTLKLSRCLINNSISFSECKYYNFAGYRFDSSEVIDFLFNSKDGCDSVVTVNMAIKSVNDTVSVSGSVLSAKSTTATSYQWVNCPTYSAIAGATASTYTAGISGNYALIITENGCTDTSACVSVVGLSIQESHHKALITISPNPSKGIFRLTLPSEMKGILEIRSIEGRILQSQPLSSKDEVIDLTSYSSGVYFLRINGNDGTQQVEKLIKY